MVFYAVFYFAITKFDLKTPGREDDLSLIHILQVLVLQLGDVNNFFGVLFHVLAVVDDLGEVTFVFVRELSLIHI